MILDGARREPASFQFADQRGDAIGSDLGELEMTEPRQQLVVE
jgi:hypothetical protein